MGGGAVWFFRLQEILMNRKACDWCPRLGLVALVAMGAAWNGALVDDGDEEELEFSYAKMLIEHNATDEDTGFQLAVDGEAWKRLDIIGPDGKRVLAVRARGRMRQVGFTEMFFETQEPENAEVPIP